MRNNLPKIIYWVVISLLICVSISIHAKEKAEQTYKFTVTIEKVGTLKEALKLAEKYGDEGIIKIEHFNTIDFGNTDSLYVSPKTKYTMPYLYKHFYIPDSSGGRI